MTDTTPDVAAFAAAFAKFQAEVSDPGKNKTAQIEPKDKSKQPFSYGYADLASVLQHVRPLLAKNGLSVVQDVTTDDSHVSVTTLILHESGQTMRFGPLSLPSGGEPKSWGSAATYARRFALMATLGVAADGEDDARGAAKGATRGREAKASSRQVAKIKGEAERGQVSEQMLRVDLRGTYHLEVADELPIDDALGQLTIAQASNMIERLMEEADRRAGAVAAGADPVTGEVPERQVDDEPPGFSSENLPWKSGTAS